MRVPINIGLFSPRHWFSMQTQDPVQAAVYEELMQAGFRHTYWQIVFLRQIGGIIINVERDQEVHVRFYSDGTIDAEFETHRAYVDHFFASRCCAADYVLDLVQQTSSELAKEARHRFVFGAPRRTDVRNAGRISFRSLLWFCWATFFVLWLTGLIGPWVWVLSGILVAFVERTLPRISPRA